MPLSAGTRLGPYEVIGPIGAGGMGEVYRARDSRLGRDVAVKALPDAAWMDADRVARFEREAQILAALNHPHIAGIYGLEEAASLDPGRQARSRFLILELVEGGTLAERLTRGPLPPRDALTLARQVADALQAAHDKGIIHRDLKPGNIALTPEGQVKVLDFGIAKAMASETSASLETVEATETGLVLGTAAYMSPEQARGLPLDKRTDIWSFGCVLYEALTGRAPFSAPTVSDMIAGILEREPDWSRLPAQTSARVAWLLRRCLEKDPRRRLHDIADARIELDEALARPDAAGTLTPASGAPATARVTKRERLAWAVAVAGLAVAVATFAWTRRTPPATDARAPLAIRASVVLPDEVRLAEGEDPSGRFALSPDGRRLIVVAVDAAGESKLWVRPMDGFAAQPLSGTEGASHPFWSHDSGSVAFIARPRAEGVVGSQAKLKKIDLAAGQVMTLGDVNFSATGTWNRDGVILFTPTGSSPIHRMSASGGPSSRATTLDEASGDVQHVNPYFLPDGRHFLYSVIGSRAGGPADPRGVYLGSLDPLEPPVPVIDAGTNAKYANGHVIFVRAGRLMALPFDAGRLQPTGEAVPLAEGVQQSGGSGGGIAAAVSVSEAGVIAYQTVARVRMQLAWFDRGGRPLASVGDQADYADVALSRDATRAAVSLLDPMAGSRDIWTFDLARGRRERLTSSPADDFAPVWSPQSDRIVFTSARRGRVDLYETPSTGLDGEKLLEAPGLDVGKYAASWSPDGSAVLAIAGGRVIGRSDLWVVPVFGGGKPFAFAETPLVETQGRFSPDGRWVAYVTNESSRLEVYVRPFPGPGNRQQVSADGGRYPRWRHDGTELYFLAPDDRLMAAAVRIEPAGVRVGAIQALFRLQVRRIRLDAYPYDVSPDGRFLVNTLVEDASRPSITLLVNWPASLIR